MKISVHANHGSIGLKIFDYLLAAKGDQIEISISQRFDPRADVNILFVARDYTDVVADIDRYDLIFMSNNDEPLTVANQFMIDHVNRPNAFLISNSFVVRDHIFHDKIIFVNNDSLICRQYWTNAIFPQYHEIKTLRSRPRAQSLIFINGQNRSWRHHYVTAIKAALPALRVHSRLSDLVHETNDAPWETADDQRFREWVNNQYPIKRNQPADYYDRSRRMSFISKLDGLPESAEIPPGYFIMPEYYDYACVIFPEANWLNDELSMTEKVFKCFFSGSVPWPIGGSRIHQLYDSLGFVTAWHFLPKHLQHFDQISDHRYRHDETVKAIAWLQDHAEILQSQEAKSAADQNFKTFMTNTLDVFCVERLVKILSKGKQIHGNS